MWSSGSQTFAAVRVSSLSRTTYILHVKFAGGHKTVFASFLRALLEKEHMLNVGAAPPCLFGFVFVCIDIFELIFPKGK